MNRLLSCTLLCVVLVGCNDLGESPLGGPDIPLGSSFSFQDATVGGTAGFYFLPPLVAQPRVSGQADLTRSPRVEICVANPTDGTCVMNFTTFEGGEVSIVDESYKVVWDGHSTGVALDTPYRVSVHIGSFELGYAEVWFVGNARATRGQTELTFVGTDRSVPIQFRIEEGAVVAAVIESECEVDGTVIVDCDVQEASSDTETTAVVEDDEGNVAGLVVIPPGAVPADAIVVMKHLGNPIAGATIDENDQIPFFLRVKLTDLFGNDLTLLEEAELVVCQDPDLHVSTDAMAKLKIFKLTSGGDTQILATNVGDPRCTGYSGSANAERHESFFGRLRSDLKSSVASMLGAQPLRALHGGLNTTMETFSDFGAVVLESTPVGYGSDWSWSSATGSGVGAAPFSTPWSNGTCPNLDGLVGAGTGAGDGPNGSDPWPLGSNGPSVITLTKQFTLPADATGATVWASIDNDLRIFVNGADVTPGFQLGQTNNGVLENDGFLRHENCTMLDAYYFPVPATGVNPGGVNTIEVQARDRGVIGFVDVRIDAVVP